LPFDTGNGHPMVEGYALNHDSSRNLLDSGLIHTQSTSSNRPTGARRSLISMTISISGSFNLNVIQVSINWQPNGKPEFTPINQTFIDINDATANVNYITYVIQR
jgi:hypothetical protein